MVDAIALTNLSQTERTLTSNNISLFKFTFDGCNWIFKRLRYVHNRFNELFTGFSSAKRHFYVTRSLIEMQMWRCYSIILNTFEKLFTFGTPEFCKFRFQFPTCRHARCKRNRFAKKVAIFHVPTAQTLTTGWLII